MTEGYNPSGNAQSGHKSRQGGGEEMDDLEEMLKGWNKILSSIPLTDENKKEIEDIENMYKELEKCQMLEKYSEACITAVQNVVHIAHTPIHLNAVKSSAQMQKRS